MRIRSPRAVTQPRRSRATVMLSLAATVLIGLLDHLTGPEFGFSVFYLLPILACAWRVGIRTAILLAATASVCWFASDFALRDQSHVWISSWNGFSRFVIFGAMAVLVFYLRRSQKRLVILNRQLESSAKHEAGLARTDSLTGLPNGRSFLEVLTREANRNLRSGQSICVAYIDVDNFKGINDQHGHAVGDDVLKRLAESFQHVVRGGDVAARLGGDEFAILFWNVQQNEVEEMAKRLKHQAALIAKDYPGMGLGISVGLAYFQKPPLDPQDLLTKADAAMYQGKETGKDRVVMWIDDPQGFVASASHLYDHTPH